jgi:hypothetical protein
MYVCTVLPCTSDKFLERGRERGMRKAGNGCEMGKLAGGRYAHLHAMRPGEEGAQIPANDD